MGMSNSVANEITPMKDGIPSSYDVKPSVDLSDDNLVRRFSRPLRVPQDVSYEFTHDVGLLHQYYLLREEMFSAVWGLKNFSGKEDAYDSQSHIVIARKNLQCIGGGRLTISTPEDPRMLPMEKDDLILKDLFPELDLHETAYGEFSRMAILPEFRSGHILPEISHRFIKKAIAQGVEYVFIMAPIPLARNYRQVAQMFGIRVNICQDITVPQRDEYEGIQMVISVMDLSLHARNFKASRQETGVLRQKDAIAG